MIISAHSIRRFGKNCKLWSYKNHEKSHFLTSEFHSGCKNEFLISTVFLVSTYLFIEGIKKSKQVKSFLEPFEDFWGTLFVGSVLEIDLSIMIKCCLDLLLRQTNSLKNLRLLPGQSLTSNQLATSNFHKGLIVKLKRTGSGICFGTSSFDPAPQAKMYF